MTRFFMSIPEAVQLVLQAAVFAEGGEVFELEMGEAVNILTLAERMIRLSGHTVAAHDIPIKFTGIRPGEKLFEELRAPDETAHETEHPSILRLDPILLPTDALELGLAALNDAAAATDDVVSARYLRALAAGDRGDASERPMVDLVGAERSTSDTWTPSTI
jgi:FlaA1/EpsC-like NDP-sugar epimerase